MTSTEELAKLVQTSTEGVIAWRDRANKLEGENTAFRHVFDVLNKTLEGQLVFMREIQKNLQTENDRLQAEIAELRKKGAL